jgi:hypothetical protein
VTATSLEETINFSVSALQRLRPVGGAMRIHADCHEAAVEYCERRWSEWRL